MKGIEGLPLQYILIIVVAVLIIGAIVGFMSNITGAVTSLGSKTVTQLNATANKQLCEAAVKIDNKTCCNSCSAFGDAYKDCRLDC
ncbi:MAG: hypothetical protein QW469_01060 [Candidatus Aenigmatarchaeota archaeon]